MQNKEIHSGTKPLMKIVLVIKRYGNQLAEEVRRSVRHTRDECAGQRVKEALRICVKIRKSGTQECADAVLTT